jgi:hypothetical protein
MAYNEDTEPHRLRRLERVVGFVRALSLHYGNKDLFDKVVSLDDHKGDLKVCWRVAPTAGEMEFFDHAWEDGFTGDGGGRIDHFDENERAFK